jgi:glutamine synthetase type III
MVMSHDGTKVVGGVTADKFAGTADQGSAKVLLTVSGNILRIGDPDASKDAQGYPNAFYDKSMSRI